MAAEEKREKESKNVEMAVARAPRCAIEQEHHRRADRYGAVASAQLWAARITCLRM